MTRSKWVALLAAAAAVALAALRFGAVDLPLGAVVGAVSGGADSGTAVLLGLRLPRVLLAFAVGGTLAVAGASLQALVRNPLADPYLVGLSGGAGLGAVLAIALGAGGPWAVPLAAFLGAAIAVVAVYRLGLVAGRRLDPHILLLGGVVIGAFAGSLNKTKVVGYLMMCLGLVELALNTTRCAVWDYEKREGTRSCWDRPGAGQGETELNRLFYRLGLTKGWYKGALRDKVFGQIAGGATLDWKAIKTMLLDLARKYDAASAVAA